MAKLKLLKDKMRFPIPVVRVILKNNEREVLFLKRTGEIAGNQWSLPGGKVEYGQSLERACIDELNQETNLGISNLVFLFYEETLPSSVNKNHWIVFYFSADYSGEVKINKESSDARWFSLNHIPNYDVAFGHDKVLQRYFNG